MSMEVWQIRKVLSQTGINAQLRNLIDQIANTPTGRATGTR